MSATLEEIMLGGKTKEPTISDNAANTHANRGALASNETPNRCRLIPVGTFVGELRQSMLRMAFSRRSAGNEVGTPWWESTVEQVFHTAW